MPPLTVNNRPNPEHSAWILQDQLLISTINSSLTDTVLAQVLSCKTSHEVWTTIQSLFSAQSSAHIIQTKFQLATLKKGSDSITSYFHKATSLASVLNNAGQPLSSSELIIYLLAGLGNDYESLVTSLTTQPEPLTTSQVYNYLLNHESRLAHQTNSLLAGSPLSANTTTRQLSPSNQSSFSNRGRGGGFIRGRRGRGGRRGGFPQSQPRPVCQHCQKPGHLVTACYHRFDHAFQSPAPGSFAAHYTALPSPNFNNNAWFPDTAATNHFTTDLANLNLDSASYQGSNQVSIGDGSNLPIHNIGFTHPGGSSLGQR